MPQDHNVRENITSSTKRKYITYRNVTRGGPSHGHRHMLHLKVDSHRMSLLRGVALWRCAALQSTVLSQDSFTVTRLNAQSNFRTGHFELPIGYKGAPKIRPKNYPVPWTDPQTQLPASSLDISDLLSQTASNLISRFATMHRTDGQTDTHTDG